MLRKSSYAVRIAKIRKFEFRPHDPFLHIYYKPFELCNCSVMLHRVEMCLQIRQKYIRPDSE